MDTKLKMKLKNALTTGADFQSRPLPSDLLDHLSVGDRCGSFVYVRVRSSS